MSALVVDADAIRFGGFDLSRWRGGRGTGQSARHIRIERADALDARLTGAVVTCRGATIGGATFGSSPYAGWLTIPGTHLAIIEGFRRRLGDLVEHPLFASDRYVVTSVDGVAGTMVLRFTCPAIPLEELAFHG